MKELVETFLQDPEMEKLYAEAIMKNNPIAYETLNQKFNDYVFAVKFLNYVTKTLSLSSKEFYRKYRKLKAQEKLVLNYQDQSFDTAIIDTIADPTINFEEQILQNQPSDFNEILTDYSILKAVDRLSKKQKLILYKSFVEEKSNTEIAKELHVSQPFICKTKINALKKLNILLRGPIYGSDC